MKPRFIIEQKITPFANQYRVFAANVDGSKASLAAYAHQKRMSIKEKVLFFSDEQKTQAVFSFRAEKIMDVHGRYFVEDENGKMVGMFKKEFNPKIKWFETFNVLVDLGYKGFDKDYKTGTLSIPHKKPRKSKNNPNPKLTQAQKDENREIHISAERRLLYTAMTRAREQLYILTSGEPSPFIEEIDEEFVQKVK